jgi:hypothetical protein
MWMRLERVYLKDLIVFLDDRWFGFNGGSGLGAK